MTIQQYIANINQRYQLGNATEHTFRGDLQQLIEHLVPDIRATNEPKRQKCGAPDYILTRKDIPVGFIEAKDIADKDLEGKQKTGNKEQFDRYKASLSNLIFTDYLNFLFYKDGELYATVRIAQLDEDPNKTEIIGIPENFDTFKNLFVNFTLEVTQTIKSSKKLAEMMAGKARLLSDVIEKALTNDTTLQEDSTLREQMIAFKEILIHDITPKGFADVYAQTIAYGLFAARLHDPTLPTFSRQEAAELIPKSNPFLRKLFGYIAGPDLDDRIRWIVDSLIEIFLACNVAEILQDYGKATKMEDPIIHFYETFLSEYDPALRKARGVWFTPQPVVSFIVRAVDEILKTEFDLPQGLADTSKIKIKKTVDTKATADSRSKIKQEIVEEEVHRVQILDPATGTGTFLAEVVKHVHQKFKGQQGIWSNYVETHLLPRLNGFELLMASYAMAHLQLDLLLTETGYAPSPMGRAGVGHRLRVFLTNSLEEYHPDTGTLFANWLSAEANEANHIKRDTPVMCVIGNPPYSVSSSNKSIDNFGNKTWIGHLIDDYKKDLNERNIQPLSDDYIKFIRFGQHFVDKNGSGVLAYISNNSFIDGIIHRQMRKHLLESFDSIYILDLHGNAKKKETHPDGSADQNVFDIMQGVSINILVKTGKKEPKELGKVSHFDLFGKREFKYDFLKKNSLKSIEWSDLAYDAPNYFLVKKDFELVKIYETGFKLDILFSLNASGITTERDNLTIHFDEKRLKTVLEDFKNLEAEEVRKKYSEKEDGRDWKMSTAKQDVLKQTGKIYSVNYRPFDIRKTYYTGKSKGFMSYPRNEIMKHLLKPNLALIFERQATIGDFTNLYISNCLVESHILGTMFSKGITAPLYLYPETTAQQTIGQSSERTPNLNKDIVKQIAEGLGAKFVNETSPTPPKEGLSKPRYITANPLNYKLIKEMRDTLKDNPTEAEKIMWEHLRNKKTGYKIRRQHIIDDFITDFVCLRKKVVIEIDGKIHLQQKEYDELRTLRLNELGYEVIRFTNEEVYANPELVALKVKEKLDNQVDLQDDDDSSSPPSEGSGEVFAPIDLLDYIYAVLHSPSYREKYKEFLKIDFPRVPYPKDLSTFRKLTNLGSQLRQIHLLESPVVEDYITQYPTDGDNVVGKIKFENRNVYINDTQHFANVPEVAWNFYIGGYQPAQKWLKDRKDRKLEFDDILHYQKIIVALTETDRLMKEIDILEIE